jgi:hypothetical protein
MWAAITKAKTDKMAIDACGLEEKASRMRVIGLTSA